MNIISRFLLLILVSLNCTVALAQDSYDLKFQKIDSQLISYKLSENQNEEWINVENNIEQGQFLWTSNTSETLSDEIALAWNFTDFLSFNLNVFENKYITDGISSNSSIASISNKFTKYAPIPQSSDDINRRLSGYKFGVSSQMGLGNDFKLGINLDYGQLDGADLAGFSNQAINTSSFELGIRNNKFGATVNTDIFMEKNIDIMQNSRMGIEIDWFYSKDTTFSMGTKQRLNDSSDQLNYLDSLTGNVQYIKFQHNL